MENSAVHDIELREQDRWLPIANVARLMKNTLPSTAKVAKDAKECMQECVSEFISFVTSEASDRCSREKRKTINGEDILYSMHDLGFENYAEVLKIYLAKYRGQQALRQERGEARQSKRQAKAAALAASVSDSTSQPSESPLQDDQYVSNSEYSNQEYLDNENPGLTSSHNLHENDHMVENQQSDIQGDHIQRLISHENNDNEDNIHLHDEVGHNDLHIHEDDLHDIHQEDHLNGEDATSANNNIGEQDPSNASNIPSPEPFLYNDGKHENKEDYRYDDFITDPHGGHSGEPPLDELPYTL